MSKQMVMLDSSMVLGLSEHAVDELLHKLDCEKADNVGKNVVFHIIEGRGDTEAYNFLVKLKAKNVRYNVLDVNSQTPLYYAARDGQLLCCKFLHDSHCSLMNTDFIKQTPLFYASREGHSQVISWMIEEGGPALVNQKDDYSETSIFYALREGRLDALSLLLKYSTLDLKNIRNETLIDIAKKLRPAAHSARCMDLLLYSSNDTILNVLNKTTKRKVLQRRKVELGSTHRCAIPADEDKENQPPDGLLPQSAPAKIIEEQVCDTTSNQSNVAAIEPISYKDVAYEDLEGGTNLYNKYVRDSTAEIIGGPKDQIRDGLKEGSCDEYALRVYDVERGWRNMESGEACEFANKMGLSLNSFPQDVESLIHYEVKSRLEPTDRSIGFIGDPVRDKWESSSIDLFQLLKAAGSLHMKVLATEYSVDILRDLNDHRFRSIQNVFADFERSFSKYKAEKCLCANTENDIREEFYRSAFLLTAVGECVSKDVEQQRRILGKVVRPMHKIAVKYLKCWKSQHKNQDI